MNEWGAAPSWETDKETLREILARKEYEAYRTPNPEGESWLSRLWGRFIRFLENLLPDQAIPQSAADVVSYLILFGCILLLVLLLVWIGRRISVDRRVGRNVQLSKEELELGYGDYLRKAAEAQGTGQIADGIRYTFLALLFYADYRSWVGAESWKANGEYSWELKRSKPELLSLFAEGSHLFERVFYGKGEADASELALMYERVNSWIRKEEEGHAEQRHTV